MAYIEPMHRNKPNITYLLTKHQKLYKDKESATDSFGIHCKKLLKKAKIDVGEIAINSIPDVPIWDSEPVTVDFTLSEFDKSSTSSTVFKSRFNEVKQKYLDFCHIYTDGSKVERKVASAYVCPYGTRSDLAIDAAVQDSDVDNLLHPRWRPCNHSDRPIANSYNRDGQGHSQQRYQWWRSVSVPCFIAWQYRSIV